MAVFSCSAACSFNVCTCSPDAIDYRQLEPALNRCQKILNSLPKQIVADGDYTNHGSVKAAEASKVDFYGSWQESWKPTDHDAHGRSG